MVPPPVEIIDGIQWHPIQLICIKVLDEYGYHMRDDFEFLGLPEKPGVYLVTSGDGRLDFDTFLGDEFEWRSKRQIRAWAVPPEFCEALRLRVYYERYVFGEYYERFYRFLQLVDSPLAGRFHEIRTSINLISLERQLAKVGFPVDDILNFKRTPRPNAIVAQ